MRLATLATLPPLLEAMQSLAESFLAKGREFDDVIKAGRTHLQDATPIRLGQEFMAWGRTVARHRAKLAEASEWLRPMNIGGTAVGTGLNAEEEYPRLMVQHLRAITGLDVREAQDRVQLMQSMGDIATMSGAVRAWTLDLNKIANDLRLLASGPRTGFAEIVLPAVSPAQHHARQGESVDRRDGQSGVLPGHRPRYHRGDGVRSGTARAQRHDAGRHP